jgi:hypothetical protein
MVDIDARETRPSRRQHMDLTGLIKRPALPPGATVPKALDSDRVRAHAITRKDLDADVAGINSSLELIRRTRGGTWPSEPVTLEGNYVDLVWHECEFRDDKSYTYVLTNPEHGYIGCLYLYPVGSRRPLSEDLLQYDVDISWWVTATAYEDGLYSATFQAIRYWITAQALPFTTPFYSNAEIPAAPPPTH